MSKIHCDDHVARIIWSYILNTRMHEKIGWLGSSQVDKKKDRLHKDNEGDKKIDHIRLSGPVGSNPSNGPLQPEQQNLLGTVE